MDTLKTRSGHDFTLDFFGHASLLIGYGGRQIYFDPVSAFADFTKAPKADFIFVTHPHDDHFDPRAIEMLSTPDTIVHDHTTLHPGEHVTLWSGVDAATVEVIPAYNTTPDHLKFHPREARYNGYLLTLGGTRIYIAGDTELTPEMRSLKNIDIAFLPVNQPYTMTVDQAVEAVKAMRPAIFYPYHYGQVDEKTDIERLERKLQGVTEVRVRPME